MSEKPQDSDIAGVLVPDDLNICGDRLTIPKDSLTPEQRADFERRKERVEVAYRTCHTRNRFFPELKGPRGEDLVGDMLMTESEEIYLLELALEKALAARRTSARHDLSQPL